MEKLTDTLQFHCDRCGEAMYPSIFIVRAKNQYDVCRDCLDAIEDFINMPPIDEREREKVEQIVSDLLHV